MKKWSIWFLRVIYIIKKFQTRFENLGSKTTFCLRQLGPLSSTNYNKCQFNTPCRSTEKNRLFTTKRVCWTNAFLFWTGAFVWTDAFDVLIDEFSGLRRGSPCVELMCGIEGVCVELTYLLRNLKLFFLFSFFMAFRFWSCISRIKKLWFWIMKCK